MILRILTDNKYIHKTAYSLADKMNVYLKKDGIEKVKLQYGVEILIINITKIIFVLAFSALFGVIIQTIVTLISFNVIRNKAFGLHASSSLNCLIGSTIIFVPMVYFINTIAINNIIVICSFIFIIGMLAMYSPSDTEKTPIIGKKVRQKLRLLSILHALFIMAIALIIPMGNIKSLIVFGALVEVVTLLPLTYKILKRSRNNYEKYEGIV